ncbi:unnamed protein product [Brassica oleracea]
MLKVLLLESMFGGVFSVPVNNPHLRKSGSRLIIANLGKALSLWILEKLALNLRETNCKMIGWESVMKMGQDTRELFFYETFLYYNPLLLITMMVWFWGVNLWVFSRTGVDYAAIFYLGPDHLSHKEIWKVLQFLSYLPSLSNEFLKNLRVSQCARWMTTIILTSMTAYLYLYSHGDVSLAASQPIVLYLSAVIILIIPFDIFYKVGVRLNPTARLAPSAFPNRGSSRSHELQCYKWKLRNVSMS